MPLRLDRRFDLACSLEVAEHLPQDCADTFVESLTRAAPVVLFSAAIPGQGGTDHINEQWQSYWFHKFEQHGYVALDIIRPDIFFDRSVEYWYAQNIVVYCEPGRVPSHRQPIARSFDLDRVHPELISVTRHWASKPPGSGKAAVKALLRDGNALLQAIGRKLGLSSRVL